jgi:anti-sigma B factor antagonist
VELKVASIGERLIKVTLAGRLDSPGVDRIETRFVAHLVPAANNAIVDLSGVDFVSSMGIRMFMSTARALQARNAKLALYGTRPLVLQVFESVTLQKVIPIRPTEAEAVEAVSLHSCGSRQR